MSSTTDSATKNISNIIKSWLFSAPLHGIQRIGRAKTLLTGLIWTYILWVFTVLMLSCIYITISHFISHPTTINLRISQYRNPAHFPAVTFCNINPLRHDDFLDDDRYFRLPGGNKSVGVNESEYRQAFAAYIDRILAEQVSGEAHAFVQWGFKLDDLLIRCIFNTKQCYRNLTQFFHPNYGNCYTFDNDHHVQERDTHDLRHDWSMDDDNGHNNYKLFLELFLHQPQYNDYLDHRAAFRIFIHRKHEVPILSQTSVFVGPNKYTKLSFSLSVTSILQHCRNDLTDDMKKMFRVRKIRYTQALCHKLCEQRFILEKCQCIEPTFAVFFQFFAKNTNKSLRSFRNISLCSINDHCLLSRFYFNSSNHCEECLPECEIIQYSVESSYANYPNIKAYDFISKRVRRHFRRDKQENASSNTTSNANFLTELRDNIVAVEISASPYATEILVESSVYTWVDLISNIGGQTGLWIGMSLIGLVEIMELLYLLTLRFYSYICSLRKN